MCLGIPMQVLEVGDGYAWCDAAGERRRVDTLLVGRLQPGTWLMTFLDTAREVISADDARRVADALQALAMAMRGDGGVDHLFADLVDREPQLPAFLQPDTRSANRGE